MAAIEVRNGYKFYGKSSDISKKIILNYINVNVQQGSIYGLLGASGCGKTTLLSCIVGQRQLNNGEIRVFGLKPGDPSSGVPGPRIGYMPQEIALVEEMTVGETLYYFGRIYGLNDNCLRERHKVLSELLELPPSTQLIKLCSGGQQRRVSFACALVHEPELLILDEPTVGLDPILREKIWSFLIERTKHTKLAVVITTHYIEEARQANTIGLMRNGILLAEDSPVNILIRFGTNTIEDAFLVLCQKQGVSEDPDQTLTQQQQCSIMDNKFQNTTQEHEQTSIQDAKKIKKIFFTTQNRMKALMIKNIVQLARQPSGMIFLFLFPILQLTCFYLAIGNNPKGLHLGIVNNEIEDFSVCHNDSLITAFLYNETCYLNKISCRYVSQLDIDFDKKVYFRNEREAFHAAKKTNIIGYIHFNKNFTESMQDILELGRLADEKSFLNSELVVRIDMSDQQIAYFVERKLRAAYQMFVEDLMTDCQLPKTLANIPIRFENPIFGSFNDEYRRYIAPGVVMTMIFFLATLITTAIFITERSDGVWDRTLIAGISTSEMLTAHILLQSIIMIFQCLEVVFYISLVFETENRGDNFTVIILLVLTGFSGMLFGLLISVYCKTHTMANFVATGAFYPMIMLCGLLWPLEGMPTILRSIALAFPFTIPTVSVRNILEKGWSIQNSQVYNGFLIMLLWIAALFFCCIVGLRRKG